MTVPTPGGRSGDRDDGAAASSADVLKPSSEPSSAGDAVVAAPTSAAAIATNQNPRPSVVAASAALAELDAVRPELADVLAGLVTAVAREAARSSRFATALMRATTTGRSASPGVNSDAVPGRRKGRRAPGVLDPFSVFAAEGEGGLRAQLEHLDLELLRDIVAEQGMDHDRLAMKWKDPQRVVDRIVEKVMLRAAKGSAFRA